MATYKGNILGSVSQITTTDTVLYTVPQGYTARVTHIVFCSDSTGDDVSLTVKDTSSNTITYLVNGRAVAPNTNLEQFDFYLDEGDFLTVSAATGGHVDVTVFGVEEIPS